MSAESREGGIKKVLLLWSMWTSAQDAAKCEGCCWGLSWGSRGVVSIIDTNPKEQDER